MGGNPPPPPPGGGAPPPPPGRGGGAWGGPPPPPPGGPRRPCTPRGHSARDFDAWAVSLFDSGRGAVLHRHVWGAGPPERGDGADGHRADAERYQRDVRRLQSLWAGSGRRGGLAGRRHL